jgi:hypothetical protein
MRGAASSRIAHVLGVTNAFGVKDCYVPPV